MPYCTINDMRLVLPEKVSIGDANIGNPVPGRAGSKRSNITPEEAQQYIEYADQYIDARLRPYYSCPLRKVKTYEIPLEGVVVAGGDAVIPVRDTGNFGITMTIRIQDRQKYEDVIVSSIASRTTMIVDSVANNYLDGGTVSIIEFPDPVPIIAARLACSYLLDRLFSAEQSPDVSQYGKTQRNIARNDIDDILTGEVLLFGQEHTGRRFVRGSLFNAYDSPAQTQKGEERE